MVAASARGVFTEIVAATLIATASLLGSRHLSHAVGANPGKGEGTVTSNQRNWAIRIGIFVVILVVVIVATSH